METSYSVLSVCRSSFISGSDSSSMFAGKAYSLRGDPWSSKVQSCLLDLCSQAFASTIAISVLHDHAKRSVLTFLTYCFGNLHGTLAQLALVDFVFAFIPQFAVNKRRWSCHAIFSCKYSSGSIFGTSTYRTRSESDSETKVPTLCHSMTQR